MSETRNYLLHFLGVLIAVFVAEAIGKAGGAFSVLGWFVGGCLMTLSAGYTLAPPEKRRVGRLLLFMLLAGLVAGTISFFVERYV
ncbi:MAG TPA: hypothetical protein VN285_10885 [Candidatus Deferrimicrobium sp.]|nr:hypothetical protein [Candidatus Deferrimicrobium sp.]